MSEAEYNEEQPPRRSRWRWLAWVGGVLFVLILMLVGFVLWVLNTESGTRWAANRAVGFLNGKLELAQITGALAGPLTVGGIRWVDPESGVDVRVARVTVDVALKELMSKRVHVQVLDVMAWMCGFPSRQRKRKRRSPSHCSPRSTSCSTSSR